MVTNGHNPDDGPQFEEDQGDQREAVRAGISNILALEQNSGLGYSFNALQLMANMPYEMSSWMALTDMTEREIQIQCLRFARRHRARYGNSRLDLVDYKKAVMRVSKDRKGRRELHDMFIAEKGRQAERDNRTGMERMAGARPQPDQNPMKLSG